MTNLSTAILEDDNKPRAGVDIYNFPFITSTTYCEARRFRKLDYFIPCPAAVDHKDKIERAKPYVATPEIVAATVNYECTEMEAIDQGMDFVRVPSPITWIEHNETYRNECYALEGFPRTVPHWSYIPAKLGFLIESNDPHGRTGSIIVCTSPRDTDERHCVSAHQLKFDLDNANFANEHQANWPPHITNGRHGFLFRYCCPVMTPQTAKIIEACRPILGSRKSYEDAWIDALAYDWPFVVALLQMLAGRRAVDHTLVTPDAALNRAREKAGKPRIRDHYRLTLTIHLAGKAPPREEGLRLEQRNRLRPRRHEVEPFVRTLRSGVTILVKGHARGQRVVDNVPTQPVRILRR